MTPPVPSSAARTERSWRWRQSLWLLVPIFGIGLFSFAGFVYCAIRIRERKWIILAAASCAATILGWILLSVWTDAEGNPSTAAMTFILELWLASVILAVVVNFDYLAWRRTASQAGRGPRMHRVSMAPAPSAVAGWYPDPWNGKLMRYWDGNGWTAHSQFKR